MSLTPPEECADVSEYARENREQLVRILRHSADETARAYAWAILDAGLSDPEFKQLETEFERIKRERGIA